MIRSCVLLLPLVMIFHVVLADSPEGIQERLAQAEEDVALAMATEERIAERLAVLESDPESSEEIVAAMRVYLEEVGTMRSEIEATLRDLHDLVKDVPESSIGEGMRAFSEVLGVMSDEDMSDELSRMIAEFDASLATFDGMVNEHLSSLRERMDRRLDAGSAAAGPRARAAAEAAELLRRLGVDPGMDSGSVDESGVKPALGEGAVGVPARGAGAGRREDIVARQLREAAERETDPELREKLWAEYEAYLDGRS